MATPLNVGLIGGGKGAFIVHAHQKAIHFDGTRRVVAGALYPEPAIALQEAAAARPKGPPRKRYALPVLPL